MEGGKALLHLTNKVPVDSESVLWVDDLHAAVDCKANHILEHPSAS